MPMMNEVGFPTDCPVDGLEYKWAMTLDND